MPNCSFPIPNRPKKSKSPRKPPFLTRISPFVFPNLTKTLGWVQRFGEVLKKKRFFWGGGLSEGWLPLVWPCIYDGDDDDNDDDRTVFSRVSLATRDKAFLENCHCHGHPHERMQQDDGDDDQGDDDDDGDGDDDGDDDDDDVGDGDSDADADNAEDGHLCFFNLSDKV